MGLYSGVTVNVHDLAPTCAGALFGKSSTFYMVMHHFACFIEEVNIVGSYQGFEPVLRMKMVFLNFVFS